VYSCSTGDEKKTEEGSKRTNLWLHQKWWTRLFWCSLGDWNTSFYTARHRKVLNVALSWITRIYPIIENGELSKTLQKFTIWFLNFVGFNYWSILQAHEVCAFWGDRFLLSGWRQSCNLNFPNRFPWFLRLLGQNTICDKLPPKILQKFFWKFFAIYSRWNLCSVSAWQRHYFWSYSLHLFSVTSLTVLWVQLECNGRGSPVTASYFGLFSFAMQSNSISFCVSAFSLSLHKRQLGTSKNKDV
jgi:hypothetical protein